MAQRVVIDLVSSVDDDDDNGNGNAMEWELSTSEASDEAEDMDVVHASYSHDDEAWADMGSNEDDDDDDDDARDEDYLADAIPGRMTASSPRRQSDRRRQESVGTYFREHVDRAYRLFKEGVDEFRQRTTDEARFARHHADTLSHLMGTHSPWIQEHSLREQWQAACHAAASVSDLEALYTRLLAQLDTTLDRVLVSMGKTYHGRDGFDKRQAAAAATTV
jgi:hypothetical protein